MGVFKAGELVLGGKFVVVKTTDKRVTVKLHNPTGAVVAREFTFIFDGTGFKRQGQYLTR